MNFIPSILLLLSTLTSPTPSHSWMEGVDLKSSAYTIDCTDTSCNVYLANTILPPDNYKSLHWLIENAPKGFVINLHLSGYGGATDTVFYLRNAVLNSKGEVDTIIEGPVYSAHAYIAMMGKHIKIEKESFFMFHEPAVNILGTNYTMLDACKFTKGTDRGQSAYAKCIDQARAYQEITDIYFNDLISPYLTSQERNALYHGKDIYISAQLMKDRLKEKAE